MNIIGISGNPDIHSWAGFASHQFSKPEAATAMADRTSPIPLTTGRFEDVFPTLTPAQLGRIATHGHARPTQPSDVLIEQGDSNVPFFAVISGELESVRPSATGDTLVAVSGPGQFMGEVNTVSGRSTMFRVRVSKPGEVIELDHQQLLALVQTDEELGEILMRAFLLRRAGLVAAGVGDVVLIGSTHSAETLKLKEFLMRNAHPYSYIDLERDPDVEKMLSGFHVAASDIPVVICRGQNVLRNPTNQRLAECLGFNITVDQTRARDLVIIGAGPAGLAAAVYAASEGLDVLVLETTSPGGQAGASSRIENYLGFPTGISGQELAARALNQAEKFGAQILTATGTRLACDARMHTVDVDNGARIQARSVVIATGVEYRKLALASLSRFEGAGIYYGATFVEAQLCAGDEVIVVGGGNAAGQAAIFLAQTTKRVYLVVRSGGLAETMSRYLSRRIEETPSIALTTFTEIVALEGQDHLESVRWRNNQTDVVEDRAIRHVFLMMGGVPNTGWLEHCVVLDAKGYIKTGSEISPEDLSSARWPLTRPPFLLETSLPGVLAVGDVRGGSVKRVASAVGEGSIAISFIHRILQE
jgi:thioredoxin reductase (NADPH)